MGLSPKAPALKRQRKRKKTDLLPEAPVFLVLDVVEIFQSHLLFVYIVALIFVPMHYDSYYALMRN